MSLSIDALTAAVALGPRAALLATALEPAGAEFLSGDEQSLTFDINLDHWVTEYTWDRISRKLPGLFIQMCYASTTPSTNELRRYYESRLTVSLDDHSVRAVVEGTDEMGDCDCDVEDSDMCTICAQRGELPAIEEALEEYYRPLVAQALAALPPEPLPPGPVTRRRSR